MPNINFDFSGSIRNFPVTWARDQNGNKVWVAEMSDEEFYSKLDKGEIFLSLSETLREALLLGCEKVLTFQYK